MSNLRYAYYPGCSLESSAKEYDASVRLVFKHLGVELVEIERWNCCGATPAGQDELLAYALAARNLAWAEERKLKPCEMIVNCASRSTHSCPKASSRGTLR